MNAGWQLPLTCTGGRKARASCAGRASKQILGSLFGPGRDDGHSMRLRRKSTAAPRHKPMGRVAWREVGPLELDLGGRKEVGDYNWSPAIICVVAP